MNFKTSKEIRKIWLEFFKNKKHAIWPSAPLIPINDPTLLWINSGVAALKKYFDGSEIPNNKRIVNIQKAIRTNDIENVGKTPQHHTFFEMMGNFSIGDYFRDEAIEYSFELLTSKKYFAIPKNKLYITYYVNDKETFNKWKKIGINVNHLIPSLKNFWEIGIGPCGPNTEIFFDRGIKYDQQKIGLNLLKKDINNNRFIEIWNIVFSQFNAQTNTKRENYHELPNKNIDTGAGLERFACILQNKENNFETDLFFPIIKKINELTNIEYSKNKTAYQIIADHIKTCVFAIADGAFFSNEGRNYVLRKLLRRSIIYGHEININKPFAYLLVDTICNIYGYFYHELYDNKSKIIEIIKNEEINFFKTLKKAKLIFNKMIKNNKIDAFLLYDTYGFPLELTIELAKKNNKTVDIDNFNKKMLMQKKLSHLNANTCQSMKEQINDLIKCDLSSKFLYDKEIVKAKIIALFCNGVKKNELIINDNELKGEIIFDKTVFYATSGGQECDTGIAENKNIILEIFSVIKTPHKQHLHFFKIKHFLTNLKKIKIGDIFELKIDKIKRLNISRNHTATHLLNSALNNVLNHKIEQKGSFVSDQYFHFDFNYQEKINNDKIKLIENEINNKISLAFNVEILNNQSIEKAKKINAKMLFTEKYGNKVRIVKINNYSIELCGGTHVKNTSDIGICKIISEKSISNGIKRITACTSKNAYDFINNKENILINIMNILNLKNIIEIPTTINKLLINIKEIKNNVKSKNQLISENIVNFFKNNFFQIKKNNVNYKIFINFIKNIDNNLLINIANDLIKTINNKIEKYFIFLINKEINNHNNIFIITNIDNFDTDSFIKKNCQIFGGNGGGKLNKASGYINHIDEKKIINFTLEYIKNN